MNKTYASEKTIEIDDNTLTILVPAFSKLNPKSIIYTAKGEFLFYNSTGGKQIKFPFIAFIGSNSYVYIVLDMNGIKQMEVATPSLLSMSIETFLKFSIDRIVKPESAVSQDSTIIIDIDGNLYKTVMIGTQTWMAENLRVSKYRNGDPIPFVIENAVWTTTTHGAYCFYNENMINTSGLLYNWYAVNTSNLCPTGWHVPTAEEWTTLITFLGGNGLAGGKMKEPGTTRWVSPNAYASNKSGFNGIPVYHRFGSDGKYSDFGQYANYWSSTENGSSMAWYRYLYYNNANCSPSNYGDKTSGFSVRCIKD